MIWWLVALGVLACISSFCVISAIVDGLRMQQAQPSSQQPISPQERDVRMHVLQLEFMLHALSIVTVPAFAYLNNRKTLKDYDLSHIALNYEGAHRYMTNGHWQDARGSALYAIRLCQRVITDVCLEVGLEKTRRAAEKTRKTDVKFGEFNYAFALNYFFDRYKFYPWQENEILNGKNRLPDYLARFDRLCAELTSMLESAKEGV